MSKKLFENIQSFSGISGIGPSHESLMNDLQSKQEILYTIKVNAPQDGQMIIHSPAKREEWSEKEQKSITHKNPYNLEMTGYEINRELYSDEEIREAFKVIDINKDGILTFDDISFFLKCMGEEHTPEEVEEMINIISTDGKAVVLDDFKKIGKGRIIPFAGIKFPDQNTELKQTILSNASESGLINIEPEDLITAEETNFVSYSKFEVDKLKKNEEIEHQAIDSPEEDASILRNRTHAEILQKRAEVAKLAMYNIEEIISNFNNSERQTLQSRDIAELITINEVHARQLFTDPFKKVHKKQAVLDAILFSSLPPAKRLECILKNYDKQSLTFTEWHQILTYMIGVDEKDKIIRRLRNILRERKIQQNSDFDKYFIIEFMNEIMRKEFSVFNC